MENVRRGNHWVPESHLRRFTDTGEELGELWMYSRDEGFSPRQIAPRVAAKKNDLYVFETDHPDLPPDAVERLLDASAEQPFARICRKLLDGPKVGLTRKLSPEEQHQLAFYIALQQSRTPYARERYLWMSSIYGHLMVRSRLENPETALAAIGSDYDEEDVEEWRRELDEGKLFLQAHPDEWRGLFPRIAWDNAQEIKRLPRRLVKAAGDVEFPIADCPVVVSYADPEQEAFVLGGGWLRKTSEVILPLDPEHVLVIGNGVINNSTLGSAEWCRSAHERILRFAHRFLYSRSLEPGIQKMLTTTNPPIPTLTVEGESHSYEDPIHEVVSTILDRDEDSTIIGFHF